MGKVKRGNFIFKSYPGDHGHHVHVYRDGKQVVKWDLDKGRAIEGKAGKRVRKLIEELKKEGKI